MQLENDANPLSQDNEGNSVFHEAAENGVDDVLEILFEYRGISCEISSNYVSHIILTRTYRREISLAQTSLSNTQTSQVQASSIYETSNIYSKILLSNASTDAYISPIQTPLYYRHVFNTDISLILAVLQYTAKTSLQCRHPYRTDISLLQASLYYRHLSTRDTSLIHTSLSNTYISL